MSPFWAKVLCYNFSPVPINTYLFVGERRNRSLKENVIRTLERQQFMVLYYFTAWLSILSRLPLVVQSVHSALKNQSDIHTIIAHFYFYSLKIPFLPLLPPSTFSKPGVWHPSTKQYNTQPFVSKTCYLCLKWGCLWVSSASWADSHGDWGTQGPGEHTNILQRWDVHPCPHWNDVQINWANQSCQLKCIKVAPSNSSKKKATGQCFLIGSSSWMTVLWLFISIMKMSTLEEEKSKHYASR